MTLRTFYTDYVGWYKPPHVERSLSSFRAVSTFQDEAEAAEPQSGPETRVSQSLQAGNSLPSLTVFHSIRHYPTGGFKELVKFVSAGRNMMRKAKMAPMMAKIKLAAEMMDGGDEQDNAAPTPGLVAAQAAEGPIEVAPAPQEAPPTLQYVSTRRIASGGAGSLGPDGKPDVYDELDKGLEYVHSMCEHAAHQFLRGDCGEELSNIKRRMVKTKEFADKEMERVKKEEPEALNVVDLEVDEGVVG